MKPKKPILIGTGKRVLIGTGILTANFSGAGVPLVDLSLMNSSGPEHSSLHLPLIGDDDQTMVVGRSKSRSKKKMSAPYIRPPTKITGWPWTMFTAAPPYGNEVLRYSALALSALAASVLVYMWAFADRKAELFQEDDTPSMRKLLKLFPGECDGEVSWRDNEYGSATALKTEFNPAWNADLTPQGWSAAAGDPRPHVTMKIFNREVMALVDSGAQDSCITQSYVKMMGVGENEIADRTTIKGVGEAIQSGKLICEEVLIGTMTEPVEIQFSVLENRKGDNSVLLGMDVLAKMKAVINMEKMTMHLTGREKIFSVPTVGGNVSDTMQKGYEADWLQTKATGGMPAGVDRDKYQQILKQKKDKYDKMKTDLIQGEKIGDEKSPPQLTEPTIEILIGDQTYRGLIDTGAQNSCISRKYVDTVGCGVMVDPHKTVVKGIGTCPSTGSLATFASIGTQLFPFNFSILDDGRSGENLFLGQDWLKTVDAKLELFGDKGQLEFTSGGRRHRVDLL